jgi:hypothetical protein
MMTNTLRDYIYLDIDRVRSLYAQSAGGVMESITELEQGTEKIDENSNEKNWGSQ